MEFAQRVIAPAATAIVPALVEMTRCSTMEFAQRVISTRAGTIAVAAGAAMLAGISILMYLNRYRHSVSAQAAPVTVLVAKRAIAKGTSGDIVAAQGIFTTATLRESQLRDGAFSDPAAIRGRVAVRDVYRGQQLTATDFVAGAASLPTTARSGSPCGRPSTPARPGQASSRWRRRSSDCPRCRSRGRLSRPTSSSSRWAHDERRDDQNARRRRLRVRGTRRRARVPRRFAGPRGRRHRRAGARLDGARGELAGPARGRLLELLRAGALPDRGGGEAAARPADRRLLLRRPGRFSPARVRDGGRRPADAARAARADRVRAREGDGAPPRLVARGLAQSDDLHHRPQGRDREDARRVQPRRCSRAGREATGRGGSRPAVRRRWHCDGALARSDDLRPRPRGQLARSRQGRRLPHRPSLWGARPARSEPAGPGDDDHGRVPAGAVRRPACPTRLRDRGHAARVHARGDRVHRSGLAAARRRDARRALAEGYEAGSGDARVDGLRTGANPAHPQPSRFERGNHARRSRDDPRAQARHLRAERPRDSACHHGRPADRGRERALGGRALVLRSRRPLPPGRGGAGGPRERRRQRQRQRSPRAASAGAAAAEEELTMELHERIQNARPFTGSDGRDPFSEVKNRLHLALINDLGPQLFSVGADPGQIRTRVESDLQDRLQQEPGLSREDREGLLAEITDDVVGYGPLERLLADESITEIMVNGPHEIWVERQTRLYETSLRFTDDSHLRRIINKMVAQVGRRIDESSPMVDARLPDGSRVNAVIAPLSLSGPLLTIRKFSQKRFNLDELVRIGTLSRETLEFLRLSVEAELNILISGGTGAGKTTLLNARSAALRRSTCSRR